MYFIAAIAALHGLKGDVKLRFFGQDPCLLKKYKYLWMDETRYLTIESIKKSKPGYVIAHFSTIDTCDKAHTLLKTKLYIKRDQLSVLDPDTFYHQDLVGCSVIAGDENLGSVLSVDNYGSGDILELGDKRILFKKQSVVSVNVDAGMIYVNPDDVVWDAL